MPLIVKENVRLQSVIGLSEGVLKGGVFGLALLVFCFLFFVSLGFRGSHKTHPSSQDSTHTDLFNHIEICEHYHLPTREILVMKMSI